MSDLIDREAAIRATRAACVHSDVSVPVAQYITRAIDRLPAAVPVVDVDKAAKLRDALDTFVTLAPTRHQIERLGALEPDAIVGEAEAYALEWMLAVDAAKRLLAAIEGK